MARVFQVSTPLSFDTATTNVIKLGHPALIIISNSQNVNDTETSISCDHWHCSGTHYSKDDSKCEPHLSLPTVNVTGKTTGRKACSDVAVTSLGEGVQIVKFEPKVADEYSLNMCYNRQNIQGSPFTIKAIEKGVLLSGHWSSKPSPVVSTEEPVNLIIPEDVFGYHNHDIKKMGRKPQISVRNSLGAICESSVRHFPYLKSIAVSFTPNMESSYFIKATLSDPSKKTPPSKTFLLQANSPDDQANHYFIDDKDMHIFKKPQNFCSNSPVRFRIHTQKIVHRDSDKLNVFCQGPARALVKTISNDSSPGIETCEVTPSAPGKYRIDIFWGGKPIRENPFYLSFKPTLRRIGGSGLNLEQESLRVGVPHRFRMNCPPSLGQGELRISCNPPSAADTSAKQIQVNDKNEVHYQCQIIPRRVGHHEIWIKYNGHNIEESPFKVHFKPRGDATMCAMVSNSSFHQAGGIVCFQISTSGAGEGVLVATVEEVAKKHAYLKGVFPVEVKQLSPELFEIQFNPGTMSECLLSITYDDSHISGSPFKMSFCDMNPQCEASGEGLTSAQVGVWNRFVVATDHAGPGALHVVIQEANSEERVSPVVTRLMPTLLEVCYRPLVPGNYSIALQWGQVPIPESPFQVKCYSPVMCLSVIKQPPVELSFGIPIRYVLRPTGSRLRHSGVFNRSSQRIALVRESRAKFCWIKAMVNLNAQSFHARGDGSYKVNIQWKGDHIRGSPFNINIIAPPMPENVHVHCLKRSVVVGRESKFWIDTSRAGPGLLSISVHGPEHPFKVHSTSDPANPWTIESHFCPTHTGDYVINI